MEYNFVRARKNNINLHIFHHTYSHKMLNNEVLQNYMVIGVSTEIYAISVKKEKLERLV